MSLLITLGVIVLIALMVIGMYNGLIRLKNKAEEAWSDIDTQLKRRYDLIPNLVETVKGYATHEKEVFTKVTEARTAAMGAQTIAEKQEAENMLTGALKSLFAVSENYPQLQANENFMHLQQTLNEVEEHIQLSRRYYNSTVRELNTKIEVFPSNIIANIFSFEKRDFFEVDSEEERKNVKVSFNDKQEEAAPEKKEMKEEKKTEMKEEKENNDDDSKEEKSE